MSSMFGILQHFVPRFGSAMLSLRLLTQRFADTVHAADVRAIQRGVYGNVTTEMDLLVGDLTDLVRPHPELGAALRLAGSQPFSRESLTGLPGGAAFVAALDQFCIALACADRGNRHRATALSRSAGASVFVDHRRTVRLSQPGAHRAHFARLQKGDMAGERLIAAAGGPGAPVSWAAGWLCSLRAWAARTSEIFPSCAVLMCCGLKCSLRPVSLSRPSGSIPSTTCGFCAMRELLQLLQKPTLDLRYVVAQRRSDSCSLRAAPAAVGDDQQR